MTEATKDAIVATLAIATVILAAFATGPAARASQPADRAAAESILDQVLPLGPDGLPVPTPFPESFILEVSVAGNVVLPDVAQPYMLVVAGKCPPDLVPPRCRADFARLPPGASLVCMRTDVLHRRLTDPM